MNMEVPRCICGDFFQKTGGHFGNCPYYSKTKYPPGVYPAKTLSMVESITTNPRQNSIELVDAFVKRFETFCSQNLGLAVQGREVEAFEAMKSFVAFEVEKAYQAGVNSEDIASLAYGNGQKAGAQAAVEYIRSQQISGRLLQASNFEEILTEAADLFKDA